ncbi:cysteine and glycine-rich protein 2 [Nephila pilipes]|uniref:Cysteine and glycine-rich protein 2 n=1 Tax=Nephila pilipes TaxID=299642 RepID=A0A8X6UVC1_NEPPI|nr:cysteine and glycine-rich protein 2 [Nephila pilipes]
MCIYTALFCPPHTLVKNIEWLPLCNIPAVAQAHVAPLKAPVVQKSSQPKWGGADVCPRCGKAVYMAEKMMGGGSAWHKTTCFNCKECHKRLESMTLCEREGEIYCKTCYGKLYGPKGYGYGGGAGTLQMS